MTEKSSLPRGLTPRLLSREQAAAYCGISPNHFDAHVALYVAPIAFGGRRLWDIQLIDRWLDHKTGVSEAKVQGSILERLNGRDQHTRR